MPDITETLAPKSEQLDAIDLRGQEPQVFTVTRVDVRPGADQPVSIHLAEFPRPWKPSKNMRRVLAHCWGRNSDSWPNQRVELFCDERVKFGNDTPGGVRISRLSGIDKPQKVPVLVTQGRAGYYDVKPLPDAPAPDPNAAKLAELKTEYATATPERQAEILAERDALTGGAA
jgi:hypothetical protein